MISFISRAAAAELFIAEMSAGLVAFLVAPTAFAMQPRSCVTFRLRTAPVHMQFGLPKLPNPFGGEEEAKSGVPSEMPTVGGFVAPPRPERPEFKLDIPNPFASELQIGPRDVQFTDMDGDVVTLRPVM